MRIGAFSFAPRLATTIAAAALLALLVSLGRWQLDRAAEKQARQALFDARLGETPLVLTGSVPSAEPLLYRRVAASGRWLAEAQLFVDNRIREGRAGFHVVTPLRLDSGAAVLVNRGWIARDAQYPNPPQVAVPEGRVAVTGVATRPPARYLELGPGTISGNVWQNLSIERYAQAAKLELVPVVILADTPAPGLQRVREQPDAGVAKHHEYALTWFALAITTLVFWIAVNVRRRAP